MPRRQHILLVEDDAELSGGLIDALRLEGYAASHSPDGPSGLMQALSGRHRLVILDVMLPGLSGFEVLRQLRNRGSAIPVILLTARGQEIDKVRGLRMGADDYVTKPFGVMELLARVAALLRRTGAPAQPPSRLQLGEVSVDFRSRQARRLHQPVPLTSREFEVLEALALRRGEAVSRADLIARIWGIEDDVQVTTRTIDQHIVSLRRKLEDDTSQPRWIETVHGYGYRLANPTDAAAGPGSERSRGASNDFRGSGDEP